jgi:hypothetical protein
MHIVLTFANQENDILSLLTQESAEIRAALSPLEKRGSIQFEHEESTTVKELSGILMDKLSLVNQVGAMGNVISDFLDEEMTNIEISLTKERNIKQAKGLPMEVLFALVSNDGTKKPSVIDEILDNLPENKQMKVEDIAFCLEEFKRIRILRETE